MRVATNKSRAVNHIGKSANNWFRNSQYENALQEYVQLKYLVDLGNVIPTALEQEIIQTNYDECLNQVSVL